MAAQPAREIGGVARGVGLVVDLPSKIVERVIAMRRSYGSEMNPQ